MGEYITLAFIENLTNIDFSTDTDYTDEDINEFIDLSEQQINENTGRTWGLETHTNELYDSPYKEFSLNSYPLVTFTQMRDGDGVVLVNGIDDDYIIDKEDFVVFNPCGIRPSRVYVDYTSGYTNVRADARMLNYLMVLAMISQGGSSSGTNSKTIKVGPIVIQKALGMQTVINLDSDIKTYETKLRRLIR